MDGWAEENLAL